MNVTQYRQIHRRQRRANRIAEINSVRGQLKTYGLGHSYDDVVVRWFASKGFYTAGPNIGLKPIKVRECPPPPPRAPRPTRPPQTTPIQPK